MKTVFYHLLIILSFILLSNSAHSQEVLLLGDSTSMVNVYGDIRLASAHQLPGKKPKKTYLADGYRIVIYRGDVRSEAQKHKNNFSRKHPKVESLIFFSSPTYFVRIGNFRTEAEAEKFRDSIKKSWPDAVIIEDQINVSL